jgi:hypothetical protein
METALAAPPTNLDVSKLYGAKEAKKHQSVAV